jgi:DNA-binding NtrC family response regulator
VERQRLGRVYPVPTDSAVRDGRDAGMLVGQSPAMLQLQAEIQSAAQSDAKVLIVGPTGAGKEIVASLIHTLSSRARHSFVTLNCAALPDGLIESELFGHFRGSFTDAYQDRPGLAHLADRGTLFFDEIGEMSPRMQAVVLRFAETGEVRAVGETRAHTFVNARIIAATHRDLSDRIAGGLFRQDLYYRLNVILIVVPALSERGSDITLLFDHFLRRYAASHRTAVPALSPETVDLLMSYSWPGNVRELKNLAERLIVRNTQEVLTPDAFPVEMRHPNQRAARPDGAEHPAPLDDSPSVAAWHQMVVEGHSFWVAVHQPFVDHEFTKTSLKHLVGRGLRETDGNYRRVSELFNVPPGEYKRFIAFLYQHECHHARPSKDGRVRT